jgi:hypothetical protein
MRDFLSLGEIIRAFVWRVTRITRKVTSFISALEFIKLDDSVYSAANFNTKAMGLIARNKFGATGDIER